MIPTNRPVYFHPLAETELQEAAAYYDISGQELSNAFLTDVEHAIARLQAFPEGAPLVTRTVRKLPLRRFPYNLLYGVRPDGIRILAVANQKRRPFYWRGRG